MLVDSHCHLDLDKQSTPEELLQAAQAAGVSHCLSVCINLEDFPALQDLAQIYPNVFISAGVHPNVQSGEEPEVDKLARLASAAKVVAIGETGLDYYRMQGDMAWQHQRFRRHIAAAKAVGKPLIIHTRDATQDTLKIMQQENVSEVGGVMHCFVEDWQVAQQAMDMGFYISFSGIVTFKNAKSLQSVAQQIPLDRLLIETDSPYLAPVPYRGKTNQPAYVQYVAKFLAELREESLETIAQATTENFFRLFPAH